MAVQSVLAVGTDGDAGVADTLAILLSVDLHLDVGIVDVFRVHGHGVGCGGNTSGVTQPASCAPIIA